MRVLLVHDEPEFFAGAEKMLTYFLAGLQSGGCQVAVACVRASRLDAAMPQEVQRIWVRNDRHFSVFGLGREVNAILAARREFPFDVAHSWAARGWEVAALAGRLSRRPSVGTLHDHPRAKFLSANRRRLMRWSVRLGIQRVACVSEAVRHACLEAGYPARKLLVIHNGVPAMAPATRLTRTDQLRLGFLGVISARKGLGDLFCILDELYKLTPAAWSLEIAGGAQDREGEDYMNKLRQRFSGRAWWPRVRWRGWVEQPIDFLRSLDLMVCPSSEFDPFPTVLLEAGRAEVAVLAADIGGVREIVEDGRTGWVYQPGDYIQAAKCIAKLLAEPGLAEAAGASGARRISSTFSMDAMVDKYLALYASVVGVGIDRSTP